MYVAFNLHTTYAVLPLDGRVADDRMFSEWWTITVVIHTDSGAYHILRVGTEVSK